MSLNLKRLRVDLSNYSNSKSKINRNKLLLLEVHMNCNYQILYLLSTLSVME